MFRGYRLTYRIIYHIIIQSFQLFYCCGFASLTSHRFTPTAWVFMYLSGLLPEPAVATKQVNLSKIKGSVGMPRSPNYGAGERNIPPTRSMPASCLPSPGPVFHVWDGSFTPCTSADFRPGSLFSSFGTEVSCILHLIMLTSRVLWRKPVG